MVMRGIGRAKRRSLATVLGVVLALVLILASGGMIDTVVSLIDQQFNDIALEDASVIPRTPLTDETLSAIASTSGVAVVEPVATLPASIRSDGDTVSTTIRGFEAGTRMHGWSNAAGSLPDHGVLAARSLQQRLGISIGDTVAIDLPTLDTTIDLTLVDFVDEPLGMPLYVRNDVLIGALTSAGVDNAEAVLAEPTTTAALVLFDGTGTRASTISGIERIDGVLTVHDARSLYLQVQQYLGLFYVFVGIMLVFGAVMAFALMFATISVNISERSAEFANMRANGLSERTIGRMIAGENLLLTVLGIVPGVILGVVAANWFMGLFDNDSFSFTVTVHPITIAVAVGGMIVVAILSMIPGIRSVRRLDLGSVVRERAV